MRQVQHVAIASGQSVSSWFSVANATDLAVLASAFTANANSTMAFRAEAAIVGPGGTPASAQFLPIAKNDGSGMWALTTAGSFGVALGNHARGFDLMRFQTSSVLAVTASLMVILRT